MPDLDQSGNGLQWVKVYLGPSLGHVMVQVKPSLMITNPGLTIVPPGTSTIFVNAGASQVTISLPRVLAWVNEFFYQPACGFDRGIWIKDLGGNAAAFPIIVNTSGPDLIDGVSGQFQIVQNRQLLRLYPLSDLTGWFSG